MPLGPEDVIRKSFSSSYMRKGYDSREVDAFLEEIVVELKRRDREKDELLTQMALSPHQTEKTGEVQVSLATDQLEIIRLERDSLVAEIAALEQRRGTLDAAAGDAEPHN